MSDVAALESETGEQIVMQPGGCFWFEGDSGLQPVRVKQGIVAYKRGKVAVGLIGPGEIALPVPGVPTQGAAISDLMAITEAVVTPLAPEELPLSEEDMEISALAVFIGAVRLGNMSLPQRLAALLLDITEMTEQPIIGCRQEILALAAAARRETVATILSQWRDLDWIQTRYRKTRIMDRDALIRIRDGEE